MNLSFIALKGEVCQDLSGDVIVGVSQMLVPWEVDVVALRAW